MQGHVRILGPMSGSAVRRQLTKHQHILSRQSGILRDLRQRVRRTQATEQSDRTPKYIP
jgi:hypothetical protein